MTMTQGWREKINDELADKNELIKISVMHLVNSNIKLKYSYCANFVHFNILLKKRSKGSKMDFLYV